MNESRGDRRRWPAGLVGALALIATVEAFVAGHELDFTTPARVEWRQSRRAAATQVESCRVLGLGTSMSKLGVFPTVIERESGLRTFNLAECAGRMPGFYHLVRKALAAGAKPEAILLEVHPTYVSLPYREGLVDWPDLLDPADCLDVAWEAGDASFFASTVLARFLPSVNSRAEIRWSILAALGGQIASYGHATRPLVRHLDRNAGAFVHRRNTNFQGQISPLEQSVYLDPKKWTCDALSETYLRRLLDLCSSRGIRVYWLIPPFSPTLQACRELVGHDAEYTAFARRMQRDYPGVVVLDARRSGYPIPLFADASHLDVPGATIFSAEVGRILKSRPARSGDAGPNWIDLPAYRDLVVDAPLEEYAQSLRIVAESATVKR